MFTQTELFPKTEKVILSSYQIQSKFTPKQSRYYQRITSGVQMAKFRKKTLRFATLTTSDEGKNNDLSRDVDVLFKRRRRVDKSVQYWKMNNDEGNGVVHLLLTGKYISYAWLKYNWNDIHKSYIVNISKCKDDTRLAAYIVRHYLCTQDCSYSRMSYSKKWIFEGAAAEWKETIRTVKNRFFYNPIKNKYYLHRVEYTFKQILNKILSLWDDILYNHSFKQMEMTDYG